MTKGTFVFGVLLGALAAALLLLTNVGCNRSAQAAPPAMPPPLVTVAKATAQDVPMYLDEIGHNTAFESVTVTPQVGGRITERHFTDGANLKKGQLLVCHRSAPVPGAARCGAGATGAEPRPRSISPRFSLPAISR